MKKISIILPVLFLLFLSAFNSEKKSRELPKNEIELGKLLFFDPILSANKKTSCASCHKPEFAFADTLPFSVGFDGRLTARNTPSVMNMTERPYLFWDGRSPNLEDQALHPILNAVEMGMNKEKMIARLKKDKFYSRAFFAIYKSIPTEKLIGKSIAAYERTLETEDSPFDKFMDGDSTAISESAIRGRMLFIEKGKCFDCHFTPDFTADEFKNIGLFNGRDLNDSGRYIVTKDPDDIGKFKVPGLRNIASTAPYMHNGKFRTLEQVVDYYNNPDLFVPDAINRDTTFDQPLGLSNQEKADIVAFMKSFSSTTLNTK